MRILNTKQVRELDAYTIEHEPISSLDLMERASRAFVDWFVLRVATREKTGIVCGTGNNGGDGLAIARMLWEWGYPVKVWVVNGGASVSADFRQNESRLPAAIEKREIEVENELFSFDGCDVLIDAIFGSGLTRPAAGLYDRVIRTINASTTLRVAVDIPSGLMADAPSSGAVIQAQYTVSFQLPKLAFMLPESHLFTGECVVLDIGLDKNFIESADTSYFFSCLRDVRKLLKPRMKFDHKGKFGHGLLVAGSYGKVGAAVLAARAALRAGAGLLTVVIPRCGYEIIQTAVPEAMVVADVDETIFTSPPDVTSYSAIGIGPGLGQNIQTVRAVEKLLENSRRPVVLDADALNILAANRHLMALIPPGSILTPHPKEFERLVGPWSNDFQRLHMQEQLAASLKSVIVLKGAHTSVATADGRVYFNSTGNPGMATGGTGDVLTGILTALLAQNYSPEEAAIAGVFLHGLAGDIGVSELGMDSLIASDLIAHLPAAYRKMRRK